MKIFKLMSKHTGNERISIDGSHIRIHQHSALLTDQGILKGLVAQYL